MTLTKTMLYTVNFALTLAALGLLVVVYRGELDANSVVLTILGLSVVTSGMVEGKGLLESVRQYLRIRALTRGKR